MSLSSATDTSTNMAFWNCSTTAKEICKNTCCVAMRLLSTTIHFIVHFHCSGERLGQMPERNLRQFPALVPLIEPMFHHEALSLVGQEESLPQWFDPSWALFPFVFFF